MLPTLVLGASDNPERYSYKATGRLLTAGFQVIPYGNKKKEIFGLAITNEWPQPDTVDTVTLYLNAQNQKAYYQQILALHPRRVIFNPGTENPEFEELLDQAGIGWEEACTLVLLSLNNY
jgi:predicted CoA-binding protein